MQEEKQFSEPEEISSSFNPLDEPINEKSYTRPNVSFDPSEIGADIPEPVFTPPPLEAKKEEKKERKPIEPFNEQLNDLPNKEKSASSEHLAEMILQGYELLCTLVEGAAKFSNRKIRKLELDGDVDFNLQIQVKGVVVTLREFVDEFNSEVDGSFSVSQDFRNQAKPVLVRILQKKGIGLTDEQLLLMMFSKDIIVKSMVFFDIKSRMNDVIEAMKTQTQQYKQYAGGAVPPPPPPQPQQSYTDYQPQQDTPTTNYQAPPQDDAIVVEQEDDLGDFDDDFDDLNDMPDWAKPAPSANDIVNEMTNPEGLGTTKPKRTKRLK